MPHFKSLSGFNPYAIQTVISVVQNESSYQRQKLISVCGPLLQIGREGSGKNIEIDLLQENRNKDIKKSIKAMVAK